MHCQSETSQLNVDHRIANSALSAVTMTLGYSTVTAIVRRLTTSFSHHYQQSVSQSVDCIQKG